MNFARRDNCNRCGVARGDAHDASGPDQGYPAPLSTATGQDFGVPYGQNTGAGGMGGGGMGPGMGDGGVMRQFSDRRDRRDKPY